MLHFESKLARIAPTLTIAGCCVLGVLLAAACKSSPSTNGGTSGTPGTSVVVPGTGGMSSSQAGANAAAGTGTAGKATAGAGGMTAGTGSLSGMGGSMVGGRGGAGGGTAGSAGGSAGSAGGAGSGGALMYTGAFTMGTTIPPKNQCPMPLGGSTGDNKSPALSWTGGPAETKSFAIVLYDTRYNMLHWVIWDIPSTVKELPEGLPSGFALTAPAGAHQAASMGSDPHAYYGPCSGGAFAGTYEYRLYALNKDKLDLTESSVGTDAQSAVEAAQLEKAVWAGMPGQ
jgi:Raf kinase inhibitor-like YbhB/YbcL family protein